MEVAKRIKNTTLATILALTTVTASAQNPITYEHKNHGSQDVYTVYGHKPWLLTKEAGNDFFTTAKTMRARYLDTKIHAETLEDVLNLDPSLAMLAAHSHPTDSSIVIDEAGIHVVPTYFFKQDSVYVFFFDMNEDGQINRLIDSIQTVIVRQNQENTGIYYPGIIDQWASREGPIIKYRVGKEDSVRILRK